MTDLLERLSPQSRYRRYFRLVRSFAPADIARFVAVSPGHLAVGAFDGDVLVGAAQYFRSSECPDHAEVALEVADSHHRRRVGARLVHELARLAADEGITHFTATVLAENRPVLELMRHSGWDIATTLDGSYADVVVTLPPELVGAGPCGSRLEAGCDGFPHNLAAGPSADGSGQPLPRCDSSVTVVVLRPATCPRESTASPAYDGSARAACACTPCRLPEGGPDRGDRLLQAEMGPRQRRPQGVGGDLEGHVATRRWRRKGSRELSCSVKRPVLGLPNLQVMTQGVRSNLLSPSPVE